MPLLDIKKEPDRARFWKRGIQLMYSLSEKHHRKQINELNKLIKKAFFLKHKHHWFLFKWRRKHEQKLQEMKR